MEDFPWWNEAQKELAANVRKVTDEILIPIAEKCSFKKEYPWKVVEEIKKRGWFGALIPQKYGGKLEIYGITGACIVIDEISRAGAVSASYSNTLFGGMHQIIHDGTEEQKERWLGKMAKGEILGSVVMTEPYAGSDISAIETVGIREGDDYIVNGIKRFQTNAGAADFYMTYVKTSDDPKKIGTRRHLTGLIIEKGMPGFSVERVNDWPGYPGMLNCYLRLDDVKVPVKNVIGGEGNGWRVMMSGLNAERVLTATTYLGGMRESLRYARQHLERRVQFGQKTGSIVTNQFKLADLYSNYQLARLLVYYVAYLIDLGRDTPIEAALSKLLCTEVGFKMASEAIQCMGGNGVMEIYPVERIMRDAKIGQIAAGTSEVLRLLIYRMGNKYFADDLKVPIRAIDEEINQPLPLGDKPKPIAVKTEADILKVLAENYRVNPGLHMTIQDIQQFIDLGDEEILQKLTVLGKEGLVSMWKNDKGQVELVKATLKGIKHANPASYYKHIPSWVDKKDIF